MLRPALPCLLACAALLGACGGTSSSGEVQAWNVAEPYLPPPDPSSYATPAQRPAAHGDDTAASTATTKASSSASPGASAPADPDAPASGAPSDAQIEADLQE